MPQQVPRRVLVCPQEWKGTLDPLAAAEAIAAGVRAEMPTAEVIVQPMSDGGPGTADLLRRAFGGTEVTCEASGPLGQLGPTRYIRIEPTDATAADADGEWTAVIESARTAGLGLIAPAQRDPAQATSRGVGEQILHAVRHGAREVIVGVGGTATNDGGAGALRGLGYRLLDSSGAEVGEGPLALADLDRIDAAAVDPVLRRCTLRIAADVSNRLLGAEGATLTYGPQKLPPATGTDAPDFDLLLRIEGALMRWEQVVSASLDVEVGALPGGGAGGGIGAGLAATAAITGARIEPGAALVATAIGLPEQIAVADLVITGEGRIDAQTGFGKTVAHVARLAGEAAVPCLAVAGMIEALPPGLADAEATAATVAPAGAEPVLPDADTAARLATEATQRLLSRFG